MEVLDYGRSFVTFVTQDRGNNARLQVESVCTLADRNTGAVSEYFFFASCKSENTFAPRDLFQKDNYDFCGVFATDEYVIYRAHSTHTPHFRELGLWQGRFERVHQHIGRVPARALEGATQIVQASLANVPLVGRVEFESPDRAYLASLEFPIKTMNANDIRMIYQVDTGPLPFPDFRVDVGRHIERLWPAYVAYNAPDSADFILQQALAVGEGSAQVEVTHYSGQISIPARTSVMALA